MTLKQRSHARDALRRFGRNDVALTDHDVVMRGDSRRAAPPFEQLARRAEGDHAQEVVGERRVPFVEQIRFDTSVVSRQFDQRHRVNRFDRSSERPVEPSLKAAPRAPNAHRLPNEAQRRTTHAAPLARYAPTVGTHGSDGTRQGGGQRFAHAHHGFHVVAIDRKARQKRQRAIPVAEIVVDPPVDAREHVVEHRRVVRNRILAHAKQGYEGAIDPRIGVGREGVGEGGHETGIAFHDVGIVQHRDRPVFERCVAQRCRDGP